MTSVTANFNVNFQNSTASDFTQNYADTIVIPPNGKVALYQAELTKKPIAVSDGDIMLVLLDESSTDIATVYTVDSSKVSIIDSNVSNTPDDLVLKVDLSLRDPYFSKSEFLSFFTKQLNAAIDKYNTDLNDSGFEFERFFYLPYRAVTQNFKDSIYFGLAPQRVITKFKVDDLPFYKVNDNDNPLPNDGVPRFQRNMIRSGPQLHNNLRPVDIVEGGGDDVGCYMVAQSPIFPLSFDKANCPKLLFSLLKPGDDNTYKKGGFGVAFRPPGASASTNQGVFPPQTLDNGEKTINAYITITFHAAQTGGAETAIISVAANSNLSTGRVLNSGSSSMKLLSTVTTESLNRNNTFAIGFYAENTVDLSDATATKYYFQLLAYDYDSHGNFSTSPSVVIYDSKDANVDIHLNVIKDCFNFDTNISGEDAATKYTYPSGLVPLFFLYDMEGSAVTQYGFKNIRGEFIAQYQRALDDDDRKHHRATLGLANTSFLFEGNQKLQQTFGGDKVMLAPNGHPAITTNDTGVTELYGNKTSYNIEVANLPISTFHSTQTSDNAVGVKRPIAFSLINPFSGGIAAVNSDDMTRAINPPQLKFLDLKNDKEIKLNRVDITVRDSKNNQIAAELTDAKVELLIK